MVLYTNLIATFHRIRKRFEQNQKDSLYTILALLPALSKPIIDSLPVEQITHELQAKRLEKELRNSVIAPGDTASITDDVSVKSFDTHGKHSGDLTIDSAPTSPSTSTKNSFNVTKTRSQLWSELKTTSITRLITLIYGTSLLVLFARLQINLVSRKSYLESAIELTEKKYQKDFSKPKDINHAYDYEDQYATEQTYLSFSWWLLNRGWIELREKVKEAVENVFGGINPRTELTTDEFAILISRVQVLVEGNDVEESARFFASVLLPPLDLQAFVLTQTSANALDERAPEISPSLRTLLDETLEYLESPSTGVVINKLVYTGIAKSLELLSNTTTINSTINNDTSNVKNNRAKLKLASILASTTRQATLITRTTCNEFIDAMDEVSELAEFSAIVYSNFDWNNPNFV